MSEPLVVACVEWIDAGVVATRWEERSEVLAEAERLATGPIFSAGVLVAQHDDWILLALSANPNNDDVGPAIVIPRRSIVRMAIWTGR